MNNSNAHCPVCGAAMGASNTCWHCEAAKLRKPLDPNQEHIAKPEADLAAAQEREAALRAELVHIRREVLPYRGIRWIATLCDQALAPQPSGRVAKLEAVAEASIRLRDTFDAVVARGVIGPEAREAVLRNDEAYEAWRAALVALDASEKEEQQTLPASDSQLQQ